MPINSNTMSVSQKNMVRQEQEGGAGEGAGAEAEAEATCIGKGSKEAHRISFENTHQREWAARTISMKKTH